MDLHRQILLVDGVCHLPEDTVIKYESDKTTHVVIFYKGKNYKLQRKTGSSFSLKDRLFDEHIVLPMFEFADVDHDQYFINAVKLATKQRLALEDFEEANALMNFFGFTSTSILVHTSDIKNLEKQIGTLRSSVVLSDRFYNIDWAVDIYVTDLIKQGVAFLFPRGEFVGVLAEGVTKSGMAIIFVNNIIKFKIV